MADPITATGAVASCIAIAGLIVTTTKVLETIIQAWEDAPQTFFEVSDSFYRLLDVLVNVEEGLRNGRKSGRLPAKFERQIERLLDGCKPLINGLNKELALIQTSEERLLKPKLSASQKALVVWDDGRLKKLCDKMDKKLTEFNTLRASQEFSMNMNDDDEVLVKKTPSLEDPSSLAVGGEISQSLESKIQELAELQAQRQFSSTVNGQSTSSPHSDDARFYNEGILKECRDEMVRRSGNSTNADKFRILFLGKTFNGKSTLAQKVLGVDTFSDKVSHFGNRTPANAIWTPQTFDGQNSHLILHDSGGFETGGDTLIQTVDNFLKFQATKGKAGRVHVIWYCISCEQPLQETDKRFLRGEQFKHGTAYAHIFVIFTKYDLLLENVRRKTKAKEIDKDVERRAYAEFEENFSRPVYQLVRDESRVTVCRTAISDSDNEELLPKQLHFSDNQKKFFGTENLIQQVMNRLEDPELQSLWAAAQQGDPGIKLSKSIESCINIYWAAIIVHSVTILPLISLQSLSAVYLTVLYRARRQWDLRFTPEVNFSPTSLELTNIVKTIPTLPISLDLTTKMVKAIPTSLGLTAEMLKAIFGKDQVHLWLGILRNSVDMVGAATQRHHCKTILKLIVGINLIFLRLWEQQARQSGLKDGSRNALSEELIRATLSDFVLGEERARMIEEIDRGINADINCFERKAVRKVALAASGLSRSNGGAFPARLTEAQRRRDMENTKALED